MDHHRKLRSIGAFILWAVLLTGIASAAGEEGRVLLSWTGDPAATMTFCWRDDSQMEARVQVVPETLYRQTGFTEAVEFAAVCTDVSLDGSGAWRYEAAADGLNPMTVYMYRVGKEGAWSDTYSFTTAAPEAETVTFAYMGDIQPAGDSAAEYAQWGQLAQSMYERNPELSFAVLGGDIVNSGISLEQFDLFRKNAAGVFSSVPLFSTAGNHESNFLSGKPELFLELFAFPRNGPEGFEEEFYSFDAANCHILVLNSWIFSGEQKLTDTDYERVNDWIRDDLLSSDADWQIVVTHIPVYAVHSDTTAVRVRECWAPIFEQCGVDLVFEGHQHVYSRSYPLYQGKIDYEHGITYIMGVAGSKFYDSADETLAERTIYNVSNYQLVRADGDCLTVQTCDAEGNELDYCTVLQREPELTDVPGGAWYAGAVEYVREAGLFYGTSKTTFDPDGGMTRAMFATVLHRFAGLPEAQAVETFADVSAQAWYAAAVEWAAENGVLRGTGGGKFSPGDEITLEQMVTALYRYTGAPAQGGAGTDDGTISPWAQDAFAWADSVGLLDGIGGELRADAPATRAQAAGIFLALRALEE